MVISSEKNIRSIFQWCNSLFSPQSVYTSTWLLTYTCSLLFFGSHAWTENRNENALSFVRYCRYNNGQRRAVTERVGKCSNLAKMQHEKLSKETLWYCRPVVGNTAASVEGWRVYFYLITRFINIDSKLQYNFVSNFLYSTGKFLLFLMWGSGICRIRLLW
jgi:hypothetical protein